MVRNPEGFGPGGGPDDRSEGSIEATRLCMLESAWVKVEESILTNMMASVAFDQRIQDKTTSGGL